MDTVQHYFNYSMPCGCGFPSITLTSTPEDWERVRKKAEGLRKYKLDWWLHALLPVLDQFVAAAHGKPDSDFWRSLCFVNTGSSFPVYEPLTGWVNAFFPYLIQPECERRRRRSFDDSEETADGKAKKSLNKNPYMSNYTVSVESKVNVENFNKGGTVFPDFRSPPNPPTGVKCGVKLELFPPAMSSAPFVYIDAITQMKYNMSFFGGITCLVQHEKDGAIEPKMGWSVLDSGASKKRPLLFTQRTTSTTTAAAFYKKYRASNRSPHASEHKEQSKEGLFFPLEK